MAITYKFSGHESFPCKSLWLKKGYDFVANKNDFNSPDAVITLGVGKNMVASIRFWLRAFGVQRTTKRQSLAIIFLMRARARTNILKTSQHYGCFTSTWVRYFWHDRFVKQRDRRVLWQVSVDSV